MRCDVLVLVKTVACESVQIQILSSTNYYFRLHILKTERISVFSCSVYLPVERAEGCVWGKTLGAFPTHEIPLQLFHRLQCLPLTWKRLHLTAWGTEERDGDQGKRERGKC